MALKVIISRQAAEGRTNVVFGLLNKLRTLAIEQPGYISGETLIAVDNPHKVVVISTWNSPQEWDAWQGSPKRKEVEDELSRQLSSPATYEKFLVGTGPR